MPMVAVIKFFHDFGKRSGAFMGCRFPPRKERSERAADDRPKQNKWRLHKLGTIPVCLIVPRVDMDKPPLRVIANAALPGAAISA